jgi:hypothetical protein
MKLFKFFTKNVPNEELMLLEVELNYIESILSCLKDDNSTLTYYTPKDVLLTAYNLKREQVLNRIVEVCREAA